ncbi:hypothetical protein PPL_10610 [Heterostelium album PN500]|uniref:Uncharacterized protein n=1 Tax=Heterostelium pallidum (strain ATCC 26659 / Pp 5 / PN500) TaxID=670386 RepID=D3BRJ9_HETP5|nr:hypothetical protein PPL_10610 [Heterostelium album PN500]EFA76031.1 hypothetical protein PPL_10610 [Heterostelium album PN500]|eukprot:XP_020428165.1 hypothetical protein PPL_10610 [Heterostelium album PN500]
MSFKIIVDGVPNIQDLINCKGPWSTDPASPVKGHCVTYTYVNEYFFNCLEIKGQTLRKENVRKDGNRWMQPMLNRQLLKLALKTEGPNLFSSSLTGHPTPTNSSSIKLTIQSASPHIMILKAIDLQP